MELGEVWGLARAECRDERRRAVKEEELKIYGLDIQIMEDIL